jgi:hypothetical protein
MTGLPPIDAATVAAEVEPGELNRLLGIPRDRPLEGLLEERALWARDWYASNGRPWVRACRHSIEAIEPERVRLAGGREFRSRALAEHLGRLEAHGLVGIAVTAGAEVDRACEEMWRDGRPDEGYFLERFAVAVVERLVFGVTLSMCQLAESADETLTPHLSPGCGTWELEQQATLWDVIFPEGELGPVRLLESRGLSPKNSILAAAGVTRHSRSASPLDACRSCGLPGCRFRRAPARRESATG